MQHTDQYRPHYKLIKRKFQIQISLHTLDLPNNKHTSACHRQSLVKTNYNTDYSSDVNMTGIWQRHIEDKTLKGTN